MITRLFTALLLAVALLGAAGCERRTEADGVSYSADIQPILDDHCSACHTGDGEGLKASGFSTESYATVMKGTRFGSMVEPGDPLSSSLYRLVSGREVHPSIRMPHGERTLPESEIARIEVWIKQGAQDD
jgi:mono/diheme cytochrome c family protein